MVTSIKEIDKVFNEALKKGALEGNISKEAFKDNVEMYIKAHQTVISVINSLKQDNISKRFDDELKANLKDTTSGKKLFGYTYYKKYVSGLSNGAKKAEELRPLASILKANEIFVELLNKILSNIDNLFKLKVVNIHNMKISHAIVMGVLKESDIVAKCSAYLMNGIFMDFVLEKITVQPKYKQITLDKNMKMMCKVVNNLFTKSGTYSFLENIKKLKSTNTDILLLDENDKSNLVYVRDNGIKVSTEGLISALGAFISIFTQRLLSKFPHMGKMFGTVGNTYLQLKYQQTKEEQEWLEAQISLLKLKLQGGSQDDKAAIKLQNIISSYEDMLSKRNREIEEYLNT